MRLNRYLIESNVSYDQYCVALDRTFELNEGILSDIKDKTVDLITKSLGSLKDELLTISQEIGVGINDIVDSLKSKEGFNIMKSVGFNIKILMRSINSALGLVNNGLLTIFKEIHNSGIVQKVHSGMMTVDEVLNKYPLLKKVTGPVIAGLLFYLWLNMSFTGRFDADFDISDVIDAIKGNYNIADIISTPQGLLRLFLTITGPMISFPWLSARTLNITTAVLFTAANRSNHPIANKLKDNISKHMARL